MKITRFNQKTRQFQNKKVAFTILGLALAFTTGLAVQTFMQPIGSAQAEQVGSSPESGVDSRMKQAYDWLVGKGTNYGDAASSDWSNNWGSMWNRIMAAASWKPGGDAATSDVLAGKTYFATDRTQKTGSLEVDNYAVGGMLQGQETQRHQNDNNGYGSWTELVVSGGTPAEVTANGTTLPLASTRVMQDDRTGLIWTDSSNGTTHNNFTWVTGDDPVDPTGNSCNFNTTANANAWCNVSDFSAPDYNNPANNTTPDQAKTGVSASEFCLNLAADDGSGVKTDWRVPTQRELMLAYLDGSEENLPNAGRSFWSSSESVSNKADAWYTTLFSGTTSKFTKTYTGYYVRCVRG